MVHKKDHEWKIVTVSKQVLKSNDVCFFVWSEFWAIYLTLGWPPKGKTAPALRPNLPKNKKVKDLFEFL